MNQMRQIANVIGMGMRYVDRLNARLLGQRQFRGEGARVDGQPVINEIAGQIVFRIGSAIRAQHFEPHFLRLRLSPMEGLMSILAVERVYVQRLAVE